MSNNTWNRIVKNTVRYYTFLPFRGKKFGTIYDIPGWDCLSIDQALKLRVILKRSLILWAEQDQVTSTNIATTLKNWNLRKVSPNFKEALGIIPNVPVDMVNLDLMCQFSKPMMRYISNLPFSDGAGFSLTVHHPGTRKPSNYLVSSKRHFNGCKRLNECDGKVIKLKPHKGIPNRVKSEHYDGDDYINAMYGLLTKVSFHEYDFELEKIMIYGDDARENNMVTFVFSNITKITNRRVVSARKAYATKIISAIG